MIIDTTVKRIMRPDQPEWLVRLQNEVALISAEEARRHWPSSTEPGAPYFNDRLEHIQQVERDAMRLLEHIAGDKEVILAAVWLDDRFKPQGIVKSAETGEDWMRKHLKEIGFPAEKIEEVVYAAAHHHDDPDTLPESAVNARVLWDAHQLTKIGPLHIVSYMLAHPAFPDKRVTYTSLALLGLERLEESRRLVYNFYFDRSRQIALERFLQQKAFYEAMARDLEV